jgi:type I restriction enzyme M protein
MDAFGTPAHEDVGCDRADTWVKTANKQFNFVQRIANMLTIDGRAAVIVPDNVLFEGGAGEQIRRWLLRDFDVHTLLRLPTGIFYATGIRANVLFFDRKQVRAEGNWTSRLWVYDLRTDQDPVRPRHSLQAHHLENFVKSYKPGADRNERTETERFKSFPLDDLLARDKVNLDISWSRDHVLDRGDSFQPPEEIAEEIVEELQAALSEFQDVAESLQRIRSERENRTANP